jgi:hypothetical protein
MNSKKEDIRWKQRFLSFDKALIQLDRFVSKTDLNEMEEQGLIKAFEYTYKLNLPYKFDFVIFKRIKEKPLIEHIERVGLTLFQR